MKIVVLKIVTKMPYNGNIKGIYMYMYTLASWCMDSI